MSEQNNNVLVGIDGLPPLSKDLLISYFELYNSAKKHKDLYREDADYSAVKTMIDYYYLIVNPDYNKLFFNFKKKYIYNEALVENNNSIYEKRGIALAFDYIQNFDITHDSFNIFLSSLKIHSLLYKPLDDTQEQAKYTTAELIQMEQEAKDTADMKKFREVQMLKERNASSKFGGRLRTDEVQMKNLKVKVPSPAEAITYMNSFLNKEKVQEYETMLKNPNIFEYIDYCVKTMVDLIRTQPYQDGNKRTFRTLLNLMFKKRNIPPVYIVANEREAYKEALFKALEKFDYHDIIGFYYYKICDSIYELDIVPYLQMAKTRKRVKDEN